MAAPKLTEAEKLGLLERLCEGATNDEIRAAEEWAVEVAATAGMGRRSQRVGRLAKLSDRVYQRLDELDPATWSELGLSNEFRTLLQEIRKELGQDKPEKVSVEHTGTAPGGGIALMVNLTELSDDELAAIAGVPTPNNGGDGAAEPDEVDTAGGG